MDMTLTLLICLFYKLIQILEHLKMFLLQQLVQQRAPEVLQVRSSSDHNQTTSVHTTRCMSRAASRTRRQWRVSKTAVSRLEMMIASNTKQRHQPRCGGYWTSGDIEPFSINAIEYCEIQYSIPMHALTNNSLPLTLITTTIFVSSFILDINTLRYVGTSVCVNFSQMQRFIDARELAYIGLKNFICLHN